MYETKNVREDDGREYDATDDIDRRIEERLDLEASRTPMEYDDDEEYDE